MKQGTARVDVCAIGQCDRITCRRYSRCAQAVAEKSRKAQSNYKLRLVCELLTGNPWEDNYVSPKEMQVGHRIRSRLQWQPMRWQRAVTPMRWVMCPHPSIQRMGGSPDRLIGADGVIECKCPKTTTHVRWMPDGDRA